MNAASIERRRRPRGVSLIEIVVVMVIVATVAAIAVPRYGSAVSNYRVEAVIARLEADFARARTLARTSAAPFGIVFDASAETYTVVDAQKASRGAVSLSAEPYRAKIVSATFGDDNLVLFDGWGRADSDGTILIEVGGLLKTIHFDAAASTLTVIDTQLPVGTTVDGALSPSGAGASELTGP